MPDQDVIHQLRADLQDSERFMRLDAIQQLARLGTPATIPALIDGLLHPDTFVHQLADEALIKMGPPVVPALLSLTTHADPDIRRRVVDILGQIGAAQALPAVSERLADAEARVRRAAIRALGQLGQPQAVTHLAPLLDDPDVAVRLAVVAALSQTGQAAAVEPLATALDDPVPDVRQRAALGLVNYGETAQPALTALVRALQDPVGEVRAAATSALHAIGRPAIEGLMAQLAHGDRAGQQAASRALLNIGAAARPALEAAFRGDDHRLSVTAAVVLSQMDDDALDCLIEGLRSSQAITRHAAALALDNHPAPRAQAALRAYRS